MHNHLKLFTLCLFTCICQNVFAIVLELQPAAQEASAGEIVSFDIMFLPGAEPTLGGGLDVVYDPNMVELIDFEYGNLGNPQFQNMPDKPSDGRLISLTAASFNGLLNPGPLANVTFRMRVNGIAIIKLEDTIGIGGPWISASDFGGSIIQPSYRNALIASKGFPYPGLRLSDNATIENVALGTSDTTVLTAFNDGTGPLMVHSVAFRLANRLGFSLENDRCSGQIVPGQSSCNATVRYTTTELLPGRGNFQVVDFDTSDLLLRNTKIPIRVSIPSPKLSASLIEFLEAPLNPPLQKQWVTTTNVGEWPTTVGDIQIVGHSAPPVEFRIVENHCSGQYVDVGKSCRFRIEFEPAEEGRSLGNYRISYSDNVFSAFGELRGYTATGIPIIDLGGPQDFEVPVGTEELRRITITNKGSRPFTIFEDPLSDDFFTVLDSNCGFQPVAPSDFCYIDLSIRPTEAIRRAWFYVAPTDSFYDGVVGMWLRVTGTEP